MNSTLGSVVPLAMFNTIIHKSVHVCIFAHIYERLFSAHESTSVCVGEQLMRLICVIFLLTCMTTIYQCVCANMLIYMYEHFITAHASPSVCVGEQLMQLICVMLLLTRRTIIY